MTNRMFSVAVLPGDGIGQEVMGPCLALLDRAVARAGGFSLSYEPMEAGAGLYKRTGVALPDEVMAAAGRADAILLGAMGLPDIRYPDGREIAPQLDLRERYELFAGVRPVKTTPGPWLPLADPRGRALDFVLIRESTEGLFAGRGHTEMRGSREAGDEAARDWMQISRRGCERLFAFAFDLARKRRAAGIGPGKVTVIDKANVFGSFYFFRTIFDEVAAANPDVTAEHCYIDAAALLMVKRPWMFDVAVTENLFGDILSDLGAGLMGGMGMAPSADIGAEHAVFQPCHGTAPDIAGQGKANPTAMILSAAMMLEWLGDRHGEPGCIEAAALLRGAVDRAFSASDLVPVEFGGVAGTTSIADAVSRQLDAGAA